MKEEYFNEVINQITRICTDIEEKGKRDKAKNLDIISAKDISKIYDIMSYSSNREVLVEYLMGLTDTTLNTICALMDFGRRYECRVLPINLEGCFNKYYLPYWFDMNKNTNKRETANYLADKHGVLPGYLSRARFLLFNSKGANIELKDDCGGLLCIDDTDGIIQIEYDAYELTLRCLKCNKVVTKIVDEYFLHDMI